MSIGAAGRNPRQLGMGFGWNPAEVARLGQHDASRVYSISFFMRCALALPVSAAVFLISQFLDAANTGVAAGLMAVATALSGLSPACIFVGIGRPSGVLIWDTAPPVCSCPGRHPSFIDCSRRHTLCSCESCYMRRLLGVFADLSSVGLDAFPECAPTGMPEWFLSRSKARSRYRESSPVGTRASRSRWSAQLIFRGRAFRSRGSVSCDGRSRERWPSQTACKAGWARLLAANSVVGWRARLP